MKDRRRKNTFTHHNQNLIEEALRPRSHYVMGFTSVSTRHACCLDSITESATSGIALDLFSALVLRRAACSLFCVHFGSADQRTLACVPSGISWPKPRFEVQPPIWTQSRTLKQMGLSTWVLRVTRTRALCHTLSNFR